MQKRTTSKSTSAVADEPEDFAQAAAADLMQQIEVDKDQVIEINYDKMQAEYLEECKNTLYEHLPEGIVIDNVTNPQNPGRMLEEHELWEGEIAATLYTVGCYSVRRAVRVYHEKMSDYTAEEWQKIENLSPEEERDEIAGTGIAPFARTAYMENRYYIPATREEQAEVERELKEPPWKYRDYGNCLVVQEVSAAYIGNGASDDYRYICQTQSPRGCGFTDTITFIGTVKNNKSVPDDRADLFIGSCYVGSSFSTETWFAFSRDGHIKQYGIHGMDTDSWEKKWDWKGYYSALK